MMDSILIEDTINSIKYTRPSRTILEQIDKDFTYILNAVTKKIQGLRRNILYSNQKVRAYILLRYQKNRLKQASNPQIQATSMQYVEQYLENIEVHLSID